MAGTATISWENALLGFFYRTVTLNQPASDLSNFPVLFSGTFSYLATIANGGKVNNANGYDIVFYSDVNRTVKLDFERAVWDSATGTCEFWIRIPTLTSASSMIIYLTYGNTTISTDQQNKNGVWDSNYKAVWHLPDGTTLSANDSTSNANNGSIQASTTAVAGKIDGAATFNGTTDYILKTSNPSLDITGKITLSAWVNIQTFPGTDVLQYFVSKGYNGTFESYYLRLFNQTGTTKLQTGTYTQAGDINSLATWTISGWNTNEWHYVVGLYDGTNWVIYFDGVSKNSAVFATGAQSTGELVTMGAFTSSGTPSRFLNGYEDEARISNTNRSADWISAEYSNQNNPAGFYTIGSETPV